MPKSPDANLATSSQAKVETKATETAAWTAAKLDEWAKTKDWSTFEQICYEFAERCHPKSDTHPPQTAKINQSKPRPRPAPSNKAAGPKQGLDKANSGKSEDGDASGFNKKAASKIQSQYIRNKKKAVQETLEDKSPSCPIPVDQVETHFTAILAEQDIDMAQLSANCPLITPVVLPESFSENFTGFEVVKKLRKLSDTSPGNDHILYSQLLRVDPSGSALASLYNVCLQQRSVPQKWKEEVNTILIYKDGGTQECENWRPIAIMRTIYKLYTSLWVQRLLPFFDELYSPEQKGGTPAEGCTEHVFVMDQILHKARNKRCELSAVWLDVRNAFGTVPHKLIHFMLEKFGLPLVFREVVADLYTNATTTVQTANGKTSHIPIKSGVKQGDPLSPFLFNTALEYLLRGVQQRHPDTGFPIFQQIVQKLVYADDMIYVCQSAEAMQDMLRSVSFLASKISFDFKPKKCASLTLKKGKDFPLRMQIQGKEIPTLGWTAAYKYLGIPLGIAVNQNPKKILEQALIDMSKIESSWLAPWQKLDAIKTFILTRFAYFIRLGLPSIGDLNTFDNKLRAVVKDICHLPARAATDYILADQQAGGLGFQPVKHEFEIEMVTHVFKLLTSPDETIQKLAKDSLEQTVRQWIHRKPTSEELTAFLNGDTSGDFHYYRAMSGGDTTSIWKTARKCMRALQKRVGVKFRLLGEEWRLYTPLRTNRSTYVTPSARGKVHRFLRMSSMQGHFESLLDKPDQGKTFFSIASDRANNGYVRDGKFISYSGFKFIHRARLNLLELNGIHKSKPPDKGGTQYTKQCRRCGYANETLPHVLCHCNPSMASGVVPRHNDIQNRIVNAIKSRRKGRTVEVNKKISIISTGRPVRPDIVVYDEDCKTVTILDVTCPFENGLGAFDVARARKHEHYAPEVKALAKSGYTVHFDAIVVGPLGTWDRFNDRILLKLGVSNSYLTCMKRFVCMDTIEHSKKIYWKHILGNKYQY
ncbi:MAG: reverse transcriptase family protein [Desulfobulbaceae bacterium]|nr:reverse transcriptase family protein [Desulfobulbaceae bacterium]